MHRRDFLGLAGSTVIASQAGAEQVKYEADWKSIDRRPMPKWFNEAKFGIFVCWGPYSVPAWVDSGYAEWYGKRAEKRDSPVGRFHVKNYGENFSYEDFAPMWKAELWDPDSWADLFAKSGAKYVITTAKYHDGFCLWPCETARTVKTKQWNSMAVGPRRDLLGELNEAGRKRGLQMGIYYSLYEWWHPLWLSDRDRFVTEHMHPNFKEVVSKYKPPVIFLDGEWEMDYKRWRSEELAAWLYNESPVRDYVVVNDRWGKCRSEHGDFYESEYGGGEYPPSHPWEEDRGIGKSYGYNRNETIYDYDPPETLIRLLSKVCGNGGNLVLDVGPTADGRIPVIMQERLLQIGAWLKLHGDAIYGSQPNPFWPRRFSWGTATAKQGRIFLHLHDTARKSLELRGVRNRIGRIYLLSDASRRTLPATRIAGGVRIDLPEHMPDRAVSVIVLEVDGAPEIDKTTEQFEDGSVFMHCYALRGDRAKARVVFHGYDHIVHIADWTDPAEKLACDFDVLAPGTFEVEITYACDKASSGSEFAVAVNGQELSGTSADTGALNKYTTLKLGTVNLPRAARYALELRAPQASTWKGLHVQAVTLKPIVKL